MRQTLYFIRHGETKGNLEHRYVGKTDEEVTEQFLQRLMKQQEKMPIAEKLFVSPMKRCVQTAKALYPNMPQIIVSDFRECDFGAFEYCNYAELNGNLDYQRYIDTNGECGFPDGEDKKTFQERCVKAFETVMRAYAKEGESFAFVIHGGTIMALFDEYSVPHRNYFQWQTKNGEGYRVLAEETEKHWNFLEIERIKIC